MVMNMRNILKRVFLLAMGGMSIPAHSQLNEQPLLLDYNREAVEESAAEPGSSLWPDIIGDTQFTYTREQSYSDLNPQGIELDRTTLRVQWGRSLGSHFFIKYDGKSLLYFFSDLQAENARRSQLHRHKTREFYLRTNWGKTSIDLGKQIVIWGESGLSSVTDELSPRSLEDSIYTSRDQRRVGQDLIKIEHFSGIGQLSMVVIPHPAVDIGFVPVNVDENLGTEFAMRWKNSFWKGDFSVIAADLIDNQPVNAWRDDGSGRSVVPEYHRFQMLGATAKLGLGAFSPSLEAVYKKGVSFSAVSQFFPQMSGTNIGNSSEDYMGYPINDRGYTNKDTFEAAMSLNYSLDERQSMFLGFSTRHIIGGVADIDETRSDRNNLNLSYSGKYLRELISLSYNFRYQFEDEISLHLLRNSYSLTDNLFVNMNLYMLKTANAELSSRFDQSSLLLGMEYSF